MKVLVLCAVSSLLLVFAQQTPAQRQIFLLIGQSNMAGRGIVEPQDKRPMDHVFALSKAQEWVPAIDPLHFDKPEIAGVGLGRSFASTLLLMDPNAFIALVPAAFGGTSLDEWKPGSKLYVAAIERTKFALKSGKLRGILWHQGEADSGKQELASSYGERWAKMITELRRDLGAEDVPVVVGQLGEFASYPFGAAVNEQLALLPLHNQHVAFVSSAGLTSNPDHIHFDARSQRELGRRYALSYLSLDASWGAKVR